MRKKPRRGTFIGNGYTGRLDAVVTIRIRDGAESDICPWCERAMTVPRRNEEPSPLDRTVEHIVPRSEGGSDHTDNMVLACKGCNSKRGGVPPGSPNQKHHPSHGTRWRDIMGRG